MTETPPPETSSSIGQTLKSRRLQRSLTAEQVAQDIRIHIRFLRALEEERWQDFPARVYLEGFLRRYAGYLGLEEDPLLQQLRRHFHEEEKPGISGPFPERDPEGTVLPPTAARSLWLLVGGGALALALSLTYIKLEERNAALDRSVAAASAAPRVAAPPFVAAPAPAVSHEARIWARSTAWSRVWVDGKVRFEGVLPAGSRKAWTVQKSLKVAGNPALIEVKMDGTVLSPKPGGSAGEILWSPEDAMAAPILSSGAVSSATAAASGPAAGGPSRSKPARQ
jgi:hypothetical protein